MNTLLTIFSCNQRNYVIKILGCVFISLILQTTQAATSDRFALVIGNASYDKSPIMNASNDATDMATALRKLGFTVMERHDRNSDELRRDLLEFQDMLSVDSVALFYYAGHGVQAGKPTRNYLLPVGVTYRKERDAELYGLDVNQVLSTMKDAKTHLGLVILDACRDSPLPPESRSSAVRGLSAMDAPAGTLIAFATAAGQTADNNNRARNGLYTKSLLDHLQTPDLRLEDIFIRIRLDVVKASDSKQIPEEVSKLTTIEPFYFIRSSTKTTETTTSQPIDKAVETTSMATPSPSKNPATPEIKTTNFANDRFVYAAASADFDEFKTMLDAGASLNQTTPEGYTALHLAARAGRADIVDLLLSKGDNPNKSEPEAPLYMAAENGRFDVVKRLIKGGANPNGSAKTGTGLFSISYAQALSAAARHGHLEIVNLLLISGANPNAPKNQHGFLSTAIYARPLNDALEAKQFDIALLLMKSGAIAEYNDLITAIKKDAPLGVVSKILNQGINPNNKDPDEISALNLAKERQRSDLVTELKKRGAK